MRRLLFTIIWLLMCMATPIATIAAQLTLDNGVTMGVNRSRMNSNFTELYGLFSGFVDWSLANQGTIDPTNYVDLDTHIDQAGIEAFGFVTGAHTVDTDTHLSDSDIGAMGYIKTYTETDPIFVAWNKDYADLINTPAIPTALSELTDDSTHRVVTDAEKAGWDAKLGANPAIGDATGTTLTLTGVITAESLIVDPPPSGSTGEMYVQEDPDNGSNIVGFKAPSSLSADLILTLPSVDGTAGQVLQTDGAKTLLWGDGGGGTVDLTAPGPIGSVTPNTAVFTTLVADSFDFGAPSTGETGEIGLQEDPANGTNIFTLKAAADMAADVTLVLPVADGAADDALITDGAGNLSFSANKLTETEVDAFADNNGYLTSFTEVDPTVDTSAEVVAIINNTPSTLIVDAAIDTVIARDSEVTLAPVSAPATAVDTCTAGTWAYDTGYIYICTATDTWLRAAIATW